MKRQIFKQLLAWKHDKKRKPLILMGARQVGKTTALKRFGREEYAQCVYLNFEEGPALRALFEASLEPKAIIEAIQIELNVTITSDNTLLFFDEIQECPEALNSLKYFCEQAREYHVCAAGSLLGVKLIHQKGFPVGKVNFLHLYPLSYFEFLEALGESKLKAYLEKLDDFKPILVNFHDKLLQYLKLYFYIGGMPEAVDEYIQSKDLNKVRTIQNDILAAYSLDFAKHAPDEIIMKINLIWKSIPSQLAKENKKFIYSVIRSGARAREFESALQWLAEAGLIYKVYNVTTPKLPVDAYAQFDYFKLYLVDTGLLGAMANLPANAIIHGNEIFQEFRGSLTENYVAQVFASLGYGLYYWTSEGKAEVDLIFQQEDLIYPLEIKSGESKHHKSLGVYIDKYKPKLAVRASPMNLKKDGQLLNCPLYLLDELRKLLTL